MAVQAAVVLALLVQLRQRAAVGGAEEREEENVSHALQERRKVEGGFRLKFPVNLLNVFRLNRI